MNELESRLVLGTLKAALAQAAQETEGLELENRFIEASECIRDLDRNKHRDPLFPSIRTGDVHNSIFSVGEEDTAANMGHPDVNINFLGSPRLALWFELAASKLLPAPDSGYTHVGVGILVHHLGKAQVGDEVSIDAQIEEFDGKRIVFSLRAKVKARVIGLGVHERIILT